MYGKWSDIDAISGNADFVRYDLYAKCYCQAGDGGSGLSKYMVGHKTNCRKKFQLSRAYRNALKSSK